MSLIENSMELQDSSPAVKWKLFDFSMKLKQNDAHHVFSKIESLL